MNTQWNMQPMKTRVKRGQRCAFSSNFSSLVKDSSYSLVFLLQLHTTTSHNFRSSNNPKITQNQFQTKQDPELRHLYLTLKRHKTKPGKHQEAKHDNNHEAKPAAKIAQDSRSTDLDSHEKLCQRDKGRNYGYLRILVE